MNERQAEIVIKALDLYSRLACGQLEDIENFYRNESIRKEGIVARLSPGVLNGMYEHVRLLKSLLFNQPHGGSLGIGNPEVAGWARVCYDVQRVIEHGVAWAKRPEGGHGVDFREVDKLGDEPLAEFEVLEGK